MNHPTEHPTEQDATAQTVDSTVHPPRDAPSPAPSAAWSLLQRVAKGLGALSAVSLSALLGPLVLVAALWGLWVWTGTPGSLGTALNMVHWALPSGQQLRSTDFLGRSGGEEFLALLPQFTDPLSTWPLATQIIALGLLHAVSCAIIYLMVGFSARSVLQTRPAAARTVSRLSGAAMIAIALALLADRLLA